MASPTPTSAAAMAMTNRANTCPTTVQRTADVANSIFTQYVVPFEAVSVVLLAALVGAVVIARRD